MAIANDDPMLSRTRALLRDSLQLGARADTLRPDSPLLGALAELDSMAVVSVLTAAEEEFGIVIDDSDVSADTFETLSSLAEFFSSKVR
jgi:acyl carrier protein